MEKFSKILIVAVLGIFLVAGSAWAVPSEWGIITPIKLDGKPAYAPSTDFGYYIWTDGAARTNWHIRWMDGVTSGCTTFSGIISLENNVGIFQEFSFEGPDFSWGTGAGMGWYSTMYQQEDGIDFTIAQTSSLSYVGFDLFYGTVAMDPNYIFLGASKETVASLGGDQDFAIAAPVPEPATMLLLGVGLIGLVGVSRKKIFKA
ncbi:MAG: PEP-CTERM sorting domain-containing protein [Deltaproteobacteria bacterium]|nr:PEP-CTERM sorting domain-containing protein [Deltaproteobacteria bacterium]